MLQLFPFQEEEVTRLDHIDERFHFTYRISGGMFGGGGQAIIKFANVHFNTISDAKVNEVFSGDDQYLYSFDVLRNPYLFKIVTPPYYLGLPCYPATPGCYLHILCSYSRNNYILS